MTEHPQLKTRIKKYEGKGKRITSQLAKKWKKIFFLQPSKKPFRITLFAFLAPDICPLMKEEEALCSIKKLPLFLSQIPLEYTYTSLVCPHTQFVTKLISTLPKRKRGRETSLNSILLSMGRMAKKEEWSFWMDEHFFASFFGNMLCFSNQVPAKLISLPWPVCFFKKWSVCGEFLKFSGTRFLLAQHVRNGRWRRRGGNLFFGFSPPDRCEMMEESISCTHQKPLFPPLKNSQGYAWKPRFPARKRKLKIPLIATDPSS